MEDSGGSRLKQAITPVCLSNTCLPHPLSLSVKPHYDDDDRLLLLSLGPTHQRDIPPAGRPSVVMSQLGSAAVSDGVQDSVSSVERLADSRLNSAPPTLQLSPLLQDVSAPCHRLQRETH